MKAQGAPRQALAKISKQIQDTCDNTDLSLGGVNTTPLVILSYNVKSFTQVDDFVTINTDIQNALNETTINHIDIAVISETGTLSFTKPETEALTEKVKADASLQSPNPDTVIFYNPNSSVYTVLDNGFLNTGIVDVGQGWSGERSLIWLFIEMNTNNQTVLIIGYHGPLSAGQPQSENPCSDDKSYTGFINCIKEQAGSVRKVDKIVFTGDVNPSPPLTTKVFWSDVGISTCVFWWSQNSPNTGACYDGDGGETDTGIGGYDGGGCGRDIFMVSDSSMFPGDYAIIPRVSGCSDVTPGSDHMGGIISLNI